MIALIDLGVYMNCIQEGIVPTQYYEKAGKKIYFANSSKLEIEYKLQNSHICQNKYYFRTQFILVQNITKPLILWIPFVTLLIFSKKVKKVSKPQY